MLLFTTKKLRPQHRRPPSKHCRRLTKRQSIVNHVQQMECVMMAICIVVMTIESMGSYVLKMGILIKQLKNLYMSKWVEVRLCESCAQLFCSGSGKCWISENELLNNLDEYKLNDNSNLDETIFMTAKLRAMVTIRNGMDTRRDSQGNQVPELLVNNYKPLNCVIRKWIIEHALLAVPACALFIGCMLIASKAYHRHRLSIRAEQLYHEVCDILEEKPLLSKSVGGEGEPWVVASWLRDHLLSPKERKDSIL